MPRGIPLKWPPALWLAAIFVHALIAASVLPVEVPRWVAISVWLGCAVSLVTNVRYAMRLRTAALFPDEEGAVLKQEGVEFSGRVLPDSVDLGALLVLNWLPEGGGKLRHFCLLRAGFAGEDWRQVRIWLRWRVQQSQ